MYAAIAMQPQRARPPSLPPEHHGAQRTHAQFPPGVELLLQLLTRLREQILFELLQGDHTIACAAGGLGAVARTSGRASGQSTNQPMDQPTAPGAGGGQGQVAAAGKQRPAASGSQGQAAASSKRQLGASGVQQQPHADGQFAPNSRDW